MPKIIETQYAIHAAMARYAEALDARDWPALDSVFTEGVAVDHGGGEPLLGRAALIGMIRSCLDDCGPTQHLIGPSRVTAEGDVAQSTTPIRAFHCDRLTSTRTYDWIGRYHVRWRRDNEGWRATHWRYDAIAHVGDMSLIGMR